MKALLSPAKKLELRKDYPSIEHQKPYFLDEAEKLIDLMKKKTPDEIKQLMKISDSLANLNWERYHNWKKNIDSKQARPAIYSFDGEAYRGFDVNTLSQQTTDRANNRIRILSGLYGILKPYDFIYPYRLEMGIRLKFDKYHNLYEFWKEHISDFLNQEMQQGELLVNIASQEYFKAVDQKKLKHEIIDIDFKDYKNETLKTISIYAKRARGQMARYISENDIETKDELKLFHYGNYQYDENLSSENRLVFTR